MDAASILLILATAGQTTWAPPDRYGPPPAVAPSADRYALPQSAPATVSPATPRLAAEPQWQQNMNQSTTSVLTQPTTNRSRGNVAPPPWEAAASAMEENWATEPSPTNRALVDYTHSPGMIPRRTDSGWTSIGIDVAAPPLIVPPLLATNTSAPVSSAPPTVPNTTQAGAAAGPSFPAFPTTPREASPRSVSSSSRQPPPANNDAHSWADNRGNYEPQTATINAAGNVAPLETTVRATDMVPVQPVQPTPQNTQPSQQATQPTLQIPLPTSNWSDLWKDDSRWSQSSQPSANQPPTSSPVVAAPTQSAEGNNVVAWGNQQNPTEPTVTAPASNVVTIGRQDAQGSPGPNPLAAPIAATITTGNTPLAESSQNANKFVPATPPTQFVHSPAAGSGVTGSGSNTPASSTADQPPWLPLLIVSLSLAGSLGANVFLGWSYLDARQKYRSLVRKTADKFRRVASAA